MVVTASATFSTVGGYRECRSRSSSRVAHPAHRVWSERRKLYTTGFWTDRIWRHPGQWVRASLPAGSDRACPMLWITCMKILYVADLHYSLKQFDWLLANARSFDVAAIGGDLLDVAGALDPDVQIAVIERYLRRLRSSDALACRLGESRCGCAKCRRRMVRPMAAARSRRWALRGR